jgi:ankyrin repeat protein
MKKCLEIVVEMAEEHNTDIKTYIQDRLKVESQVIEKALFQKATGVFMWIILIVEILNKLYDSGNDASDLQEQLDETPTELEALFGNFFQAGHEDPKTVVMLQWVLLAERPLTPQQLYFAVLASTEGGLKPWNKAELSLGTIRRFINKYSKGLIDCRGTDDSLDDILDLHPFEGGRATVQFIHTTVKDFLLRKGRLGTLDPSLRPSIIGASHDRLFKSCLSYLRSDGIDLLVIDLTPEDIQDPLDNFKSKITRKYPFLKYASRYIFSHAEKAQAEGVNQDVHETCPALQDLHEVFHYRHSPPHGEGWLLSILSIECHTEIIKLLIEHGANVNAQSKTYGSVLAAASGSEKDSVYILRLLLEYGADVNAQGGYFGNALQVASGGGKNGDVQRRIVQILLDHGANVNARGGYYETSLQAASTNEYGDGESTVKLLLAHGANVNIQGGHFGNALQAAASAKNSESIVKLLLNYGADVNAKGGLHGTTLQAAATFAKGESTVQLLLEHGADVNIQGGRNGTALQAAAHYGGLQVVELLLKYGADVNALGGVDGSALHAAALLKGNKSIVELLLDHGADVNALGGPYCTALQAASRPGGAGKEIVELLLRYGADVNIRGGEYGSALQAAQSSYYHGKEREEIVELLIKHGA